MEIVLQLKITDAIFSAGETTAQKRHLLPAGYQVKNVKKSPVNQWIKKYEEDIREIFHWEALEPGESVLWNCPSLGEIIGKAPPISQSPWMAWGPTYPSRKPMTCALVQLKFTDAYLTLEQDEN